MLDKFTFGKTPGAIYLADRLNLINSSKWTRKVSSRIGDVQTIISQLVAAHELGAVSVRTLAFMTDVLRAKIDDEAANNVLEGLLPRKTNINDVLDTITPETLIERSSRRLTRLGKPNTFY